MSVLPVAGRVLGRLFGVACALGVAQAAAQDAPRPNIVYIVADDLGYADTGYQGSSIPTPTLDELAKTGAELTNFYVQPMCTPTRAALMTGRYPLRYGLQIGVIPGAGTYGVPLDEYMLPQMLKDAGYHTAMVGKWHLGHADANMWPMQRGFESFYGATVGEIDHFTHESHGVPDWYRGNEPVVEAGYDNILFGDEAVKVIKEQDGKEPFFLYLAFTAPHTPYQAPKEYLDRFPDIKDPNKQAYAAMVAVVDDQVGRVVKALDEKGMRDNTLIVFHSDNGGVVNSLFAGDTKVEGGLPASNAPLRDGKGTIYEGGTKVAALANWPDHVKPGKHDGLMHVVDMFPTLADLAGGSTAKSKPLDGMDMWPVIADGATSPRTEIVYNVDPLMGAVREGDWKLVWKASLPPAIELFNLKDDPAEATNLAAEMPSEVADLQARIIELSTQMAPPQLIMEAIRLTFYAPPVSGDPSVLLNQGD
ncbi:arylsulfatase [Tabrizicola sp. J26]|uniref:arylsulfatase B n=1 Tax=Alitabrizicola rongguiensis TaxID=2909234 RepID=UPI001F290CF3|nr:arylsulfatase [Tabrizicola rongguiensis]MCF1708648.1 arylsulfatase [Tabrizicola rongguiensis]